MNRAAPREIIRHVGLNFLTGALLRAMALLYATRPALRRLLKGRDGWLEFTVAITTRDGSVAWSLACRGGRMRVRKGVAPDADITLRLVDEEALLKLLRSTPEQVLQLMLRNRLIADGNWVFLQLFSYLVARATGRGEVPAAVGSPPDPPVAAPADPPSPTERLRGEPSDPGVRYLDDPYLADLSLDDFPRLRSFLHDHLHARPVVCAERSRLLTSWFREHGFERDAAGQPWDPVARQGKAFAHIMRHKAPVIRPGDRLPGTTTCEPTTGSVIFPDAQGGMIWAELDTMGSRELIPFEVPADVARELHHDVFPFWVRRNFREWVRQEHGDQPCQALDERWVAYFVWKSVGISHTVPDFSRLLGQGIDGLCADIERRRGDGDAEARTTLSAMIDCLQSIVAYAEGLADHAANLATSEPDPARTAELEDLARICRRVPRAPARTLHEALVSIWITWVALHNENNDTGLSLGRLDQLLQPFFEADMEALDGPEAREAGVREAVELCGAFFLRCADHFPLLPDIGNYLFGGASSTQAVTLGGLTRDGRDAVVDMSYVLLKVTELLSIRDVNVNARYALGVSSDTWLRRLCEVNVATAGTPAMHCDDAVMASLAQHGYPIEDTRDWSATGCVEPSISGKHMGHTGSILMNLVAGLEMALCDGRHPLIGEQIGPHTGDPERGDFADFDAFFEAWATQQAHLIGLAVQLNNRLAAVHAQHRPTPLLSALMGGTLESGRDVTRGGATYNSSGTSNIGLVDVADSLLAIRTLVFEQGVTDFEELSRALRTNFEQHPTLAARARSRVPLFGSGNPAAVAMVNRVARRVRSIWATRRNYRDGPYTCGFWSMSQHVAYGNLSGALPSGRRAGKAFTPGLTPQPIASKSFLDNIRDVAALDPRAMDNNMAFNVKLVPAAEDSREKTVGTMAAWVKSYFELGGMQIQFNVVTADTLRDAMANPEAYRGLLVRISGYNAYFVTLNREIQLELIERAEFGM